MELKNIELNDYQKLKKYLQNDNELSCENSFANLFLWHGDYRNSFSLINDCLIIKTQDGDNVLYRLPLGNDFNKAMESLRIINGALPNFYAFDGQAFDKFKSKYSDYYEIYECRDEFEYIYKTDDLANLSGKKYHSKRNHISAFSKKYNWRYERIDDSNVEKINECAKKWYQAHNENDKGTISIDRDESKLLIENMNELDLVGGAIFVDNNAVAFTIGTPLNNRIFDIMVEKALPEFSTAYSVINREFAKNELLSYEYINREDDMGVEGLRKAKLSYKPEILLKKYYCYFKGK